MQAVDRLVADKQVQAVEDTQAVVVASSVRHKSAVLVVECREGECC